MRDQGVAGRAPVHRDQSLLVSGADDQVGLSVAEAATLGYYSRVQIDGDLVGNGTAPVGRALICALSGQ
jgi:hypothetical protein